MVTKPEWSRKFCDSVRWWNGQVLLGRPRGEGKEKIKMIAPMLYFIGGYRCYLSTEVKRTRGRHQKLRRKKSGKTVSFVMALGCVWTSK